MKTKQFKKLYKLLKVGKPHSGFTLIELLSGLIMSTIVVAGLGYGLYHITKQTRNETAKVTARNESSRTIDFVSDEVRRAQTLEVHNTSTEETNKSLDITAVAPNYKNPENIDSSTLKHVLALDMDFAESIVYSVAKPNANSSWKGPYVLYRWGPTINDDGQYEFTDNVAQWGTSAIPLIEGLEDSAPLPEDCGNITTYTGFFACMEDGDGDGLAIAAKLYVNSAIDSTYGASQDTNYDAAVEVVARARDVSPDESEDDERTTVYFKTLNADYHVHTMTNALSGDPVECNESKTWTMRTDFINGANSETWIHDPTRQGQQIDINPGSPLQILSIPVGYGTCEDSNGPADPLSRGNALHDNKDTYAYDATDQHWEWDTMGNPVVELSEFTIDFTNPLTFNGNDNADPEASTDYPDPPDKSHIKVLKRGSEICDPCSLYGYNDDLGTPGNAEKSLGKFLLDKGYAVIDSSTGNYRIAIKADLITYPNLKILEDTERIIAVEIGQLNNGKYLDPPINNIENPGWDLQDSVFIMSTDKFEEQHTFP